VQRVHTPSNAAIAAATASVGIGPSKNEILEDERSGLIDVYNRQVLHGSVFVSWDIRADASTTIAHTSAIQQTLNQRPGATGRRVSCRTVHIRTLRYGAAGGNQLRQPRRNDATTSPGKPVGAEFVGHELYNRLKEFLLNHVQTLLRVCVCCSFAYFHVHVQNAEDKEGENVLIYYTEQLENFQFSSRVVNSGH
jgi:hypothetical protein